MLFHAIAAFELIFAATLAILVLLLLIILLALFGVLERLALLQDAQTLHFALLLTVQLAIAFVINFEVVFLLLDVCRRSRRRFPLLAFQIPRKDAFMPASPLLLGGGGQEKRVFLEIIVICLILLLRLFLFSPSSGKVDFEIVVVALPVCNGALLYLVILLLLAVLHLDFAQTAARVDILQSALLLLLFSSMLLLLLKTGFCRRVVRPRTFLGGGEGYSTLAPDLRNVVIEVGISIVPFFC